MLEFQDIDGKKVAELKGPTDAGLHVLNWNTAMRPPAAAGAVQAVDAPLEAAGADGVAALAGGRFLRVLIASS